MERKSRRRWQYLFCFAESDFTPRQGHQHSAFVTAELQQASPVCRGVVGETVGALLGSAGGEVCGRLKSFHPLLALPCGHVRTAQRRGKGWRGGGVTLCMWVETGRRLRVRDGVFKRRPERAAGGSCRSLELSRDFRSCVVFTGLVDAEGEASAFLGANFPLCHNNYFVILSLITAGPLDVKRGETQAPERTQRS